CAGYYYGSRRGHFDYW
nr:immunoglobulin heavy chain junction region [Mus musculus]MBK4196368.1 immunoglobulin heavy chain junction region [Mus musculus]MBK4197367.1 immunoglobulin heavy chain junction region [Mus musculus]